MNITGTLPIICLLLFSVACKSSKSESTQGAPINQLTITKRTSSVSQDTLNPKNFTATEFKTGENLTSVHFVDENHGWIGGKGTLYKTEDGGTSWNQIKVGVPNKAYVKDIVFVGATSGWIALQKSSPLATDYQENHFWLMNTNDGGQSWKVQYEEKEAEMTALSFSDPRNGWITGIKFLGLRPFRFTYLILRTVDQGEHWDEVSEELKNLTADRKKTTPDTINAGVMGIIIPGPLSATVITNEMEIFKTSNGGKNWQQVGVIQAQLDQTGIRRVRSTENGKVWVLGSEDSREGTWGSLTIEKSEASWMEYKLSGVYFADAVLLPGNQYLACGYVVKNNLTNQQEREGVVLYSRDEGQNWSVLYRSRESKSINSISAVMASRAIAVGDNGLVLRIQLGPNS